MLCQGILTLRVRPLHLSFRTVSGLTSDSRRFDKTFSGTDDRILNATGSCFEYFLSATATQMV